MAIGATPVLQKGIGAELPNRSPIQQAFADPNSDRGPPPPNHYPLVTPEGTIPVAELEWHGRLRNSRHAWQIEEPAYVELGAEYDRPYREDEIAELASWEPAQRVAATRAEPAPPVVVIMRGSQVGQSAAPRQRTLANVPVQHMEADPASRLEAPLP